MEFEWDEQKRKANIAKHGLDFADAIKVFRDERLLEGFDAEHSEDEERWWAIGMTNNVLLVVYTERGESTRIISARKATSDEQEAYYKSFSV